MSPILLSRRRLLCLSAAGISSAALGSWEGFDFLGDRDGAAREFLEKANSLTYRVQRLLVREGALAPEYTEGEVRQGQRANG